MSECSGRCPRRLQFPWIAFSVLMSCLMTQVCRFLVVSICTPRVSFVLSVRAVSIAHSATRVSLISRDPVHPGFGNFPRSYDGRGRTTLQRGFKVHRYSTSVPDSGFWSGSGAQCVSPPRDSTRREWCRFTCLWASSKDKFEDLGYVLNMSESKLFFTNLSSVEEWSAVRFTSPRHHIWDWHKSTCTILAESRVRLAP